MVLPDSHGVSRVPRYSGTVSVTFNFRYGTFTLYGQASQLVLLSNCESLDDCPTTPPCRNMTVWAIPLSLAATPGITLVFSSSGYLDVSVHRVRLPINRDTMPSTWWVAPFGNLRVKAC